MPWPCTHKHTDTHTFLYKGSSCFQLMPSTAPAAAWHWVQPQCQGFDCLRAGAVAGFSSPALLLLLGQQT